jgi:hypothetical protein
MKSALLRLIPWRKEIMKMKLVSVFFAHLSSMEKKPTMRVSVIRVASAILLVIFLLGCAGKPVQPEQIEKMNEQEAYEKLFWGMKLASYYVGWGKTSRESFIRNVTQKIFQYHAEWDQQKREAMTNAAIRFPTSPFVNIENIEEYSDIFGKTWLLEVFKDPKSTEILLAALKVHKCMILRIFPAFIRIGKTDTEVLLIEAMERCGTADPEMARYFMNCGNHKLMVAGMIWTRKKGIKITRSSNREYPKWGSLKTENGGKKGGSS